MLSVVRLLGRSYLKLLKGLEFICSKVLKKVRVEMIGGKENM
jgi:hypothetical protein